MNIITTEEELQASVNSANGARRTRIIGQDEIARMAIEIARADNKAEVTLIRVYSYSGFVPRSYKARADITVLEAIRSPPGWNIRAIVTDAHRKNGVGAIVTLNGRAV